MFNLSGVQCDISQILQHPAAISRLACILQGVETCRYGQNVCLRFQKPLRLHAKSQHFGSHGIQVCPILPEGRDMGPCSFWRRLH